MKMNAQTEIRARKYINDYAEALVTNPTATSKEVKALLKANFGWDDASLLNACWSMKRRTAYLRTDRANDCPSPEGFAWAKTAEPAFVFDGMLPVGAPTDGSVPPVKENAAPATDGAATTPPAAPKAPKAAPAPKEAAPTVAPTERAEVAVKPPANLPEWYFDVDTRRAVIETTPCFGGIRDHAECGGCAVRVDCTKAQLVAISRLYKGLKETGDLTATGALQNALHKATDPSTVRAAATAGERTFVNPKVRTDAETGLPIEVGAVVKYIEGKGVVRA